MHTQLLIDNTARAASDSQKFTWDDPVTGDTITTMASGTVQDAIDAVDSAERAFATWSQTGPSHRRDILIKAADLLEARAEEVTQVMSSEVSAAEGWSQFNVYLTTQCLRQAASLTSRISGETIPTDRPGVFSMTVRQPAGVVLSMAPWNAPGVLGMRSLAYPLACGNTVVLKPSELASLTTLRMAELIQETDLPPGVVNIVTGYGPTVGAAISEHPDINKVSFTGSTAVGKQILQASTGNLKRTTLELGGKTPNIIFPDADLDRAIAAAVFGFTRNSGQICSAGTRVFVHESIHDEVTEKITKLAAEQKVGMPFDPETKLGPVISAKQLDRVMSYVHSGSSDGAALRTGGQRLDGKGYFVAPTVFSDVANSMKIAREEIFGPVAAIIPFRDEDDAVFQGNDSTYGLAAGIWTRDISRAHKVARAIRAGRVWINTFGETDPVMPFGGFKQSGLGREFGIDSIMAYTETKSVQVRF